MLETSRSCILFKSITLVGFQLGAQIWLRTRLTKLGFDQVGEVRRKRKWLTDSKAQRSFSQSRYTKQKLETVGRGYPESKKIDLSLFMITGCE